MSLMQEISYWWNVERPKRQRERTRNFAEQLLAQEEAKLKELKAFDAQCKHFTYAKEIVECSGKIAKLKRIIEQNQ